MPKAFRKWSGLVNTSVVNEICFNDLCMLSFVLTFTNVGFVVLSLISIVQIQKWKSGFSLLDGAAGVTSD